MFPFLRRVVVALCISCAWAITVAFSFPLASSMDTELSSMSVESETSAQKDQSMEESSHLNQEGIKLYDQEQYEAAVEKFEKAWKLDPQNSHLRENLKNAYLQWGVWLMKKDQVNKSVDVLERGEEIFPDAPLFKKYLGLGYIRQSRSTAAQHSLEGYLEDSSEKDPAVLFELGRLLYQQAQYPEAESYFQAVLRIEPKHAGASQYLERARREQKVHGPIWKQSNSHFQVQFEGYVNAEAGQLVLIVLEEAFQRIGAEIGFYPSDTITATLYTNQQFQGVTGGPHWASGLFDKFDGRIKLPIGGVNSRTQDLERIIFHEFTHTLIFRMSGGHCPSWLNEGLAQYEEGSMTAPQEQVCRGMAKAGFKIPIKSLEGPFGILQSRQAVVAYTQSLTVVGYLISSYGMVTIRKCLDGLNEGSSMEDVLYSTMGLSYQDLDSQWWKYFQRKYGP